MKHSNGSRAFFVAIAFLLVVFPAASPSQTSSKTPWKNKATVSWSGAPLRETLTRFADAQRFTLLLDRRIDPATPLDFHAMNQPLDRLLPAAARSLDLETVTLSGLVYLGPKESVSNLERLIKERQTAVQSLPTRTAAKYRKSLRFDWKILCQPREMLEEVASKAGLRIRNPEAVPHDLWNETSLQGTTLEILCVLLVGFDMTFHWDNDGETIVLASLPEGRRVEVVQARPRSRATATENAPSEPQSPPDIPLARRRFTLRVEDQSLKKLLETLAQRLGLTLQLDEKSLEAKGVSTEASVTFEVKNASASELFQAVLKPLKLEFRIRGDTIIVR